MGFLGDIGRALAGVPPRHPAETAAYPSVKSTATYYEGSRKIIPRVEVEHVDPHVSSDRLELWVTLKNHSDYDVQIGRVVMFGQRIDVGRFLKPGEAQEVKVYNGALPRNDAYHKAEFYFKIVENGDYFCADHTIRYHYDKNHYVPHELDPIHPIRDV